MFPMIPYICMKIIKKEKSGRIHTQFKYWLPLGKGTKILEVEVKRRLWNFGLSFKGDVLQKK